MNTDKHPCDIGEGEIEHDWEVIHDWEGDPGVIGGTHSFQYLRCRYCGKEDYDLDPSDYAPQLEDWD